MSWPCYWGKGQYYKMYFVMLKNIFEPSGCYNIYLDIKDTLGASKVSKLHDVLANNAYDFSREMIQKVQQIQSNESELLQLTDLFIGALSYLHRGLEKSHSKLTLIDRIRERSGISLKQNTLMRATKVNIFLWQGGA